MISPRTMVVGILAFFGASLLVLHVLYRRVPPAPAVLAPAAPPPAVALRAGGDGVPAPTAPVPEQAGPLVAVSAEWERRVNDCVERNVHGPGYDDVRPTLPGRWPALKRARERRRLRRLAVRAACEEELAR